MGRRSMVLAAGVWLAVVVVVSVATWTVIDAAGRDVTTRPASDPAAVGGVAPTVVPRSTTPSPTTRPRPHRRPTRTPTAGTTGPARPLPSAQRTDVPGAGATTPRTVPATTAPAPRPTTQAPPPPQPEERTWSGGAGSVTARCTGGTIGLASASPANGWRMAVDERGPSRIQVEFHRAAARSGADDGREEGDTVEVRAECGGGVPRFRVDG